VREVTDTAVKLKMRDLSDAGTTVGGLDIRVVEKFWWSWQIRQSVQPLKLVLRVVPDPGLETEAAPGALLPRTRFPCLCAASTVVP